MVLQPGKARGTIMGISSGRLWHCIFLLYISRQVQQSAPTLRREMSFTGWPDSGQRFQSSIPLTSTFSLPVSISEAGRLDGTGTLHINDRMLDQLFKLVHCLAWSETLDSRSSLTHLIRRPLIPLSAGKWREGRTPISPLLVKTKARLPADNRRRSPKVIPSSDGLPGSNVPASLS